MITTVVRKLVSYYNLLGNVMMSAYCYYCTTTRTTQVGTSTDSEVTLFSDNAHTVTTI